MILYSFHHTLFVTFYVQVQQTVAYSRSRAHRTFVQLPSHSTVAAPAYSRASVPKTNRVYASHHTTSTNATPCVRV